MKGDPQYFLDLSTVRPPKLQSDCIHMGTARNNRGDLLACNNKYLIRNSQPWFMVMGEFHFSRYPREEWEDGILTMKAAGIEVIATYIFWIHHEEEKGIWNWENNRDLRYFVSLCQKHQLFVFIRIGPWCHGEARNGGHPDWIMRGVQLRKNNPLYMSYAKELYRQIHEQIKGLYFKEGGPIIGTQIENERTFNDTAGLDYMLALKKMAIDIGIDVPFYTATGWQGYDMEQRDLIPMWGAYPDAPWNRGAHELVDNKRCFHFSPYLHESDIGNDLLASKPKLGKIEDYSFPFLNVENGAGTQCTHHRRPTFTLNDGASLIMAKIGSGANGIGYYVFHGGSNPIGKLSTLQESRSFHYPNDLPIISYDFYAPIGEWGQLRASYGKLKQIHYFLHDFGKKLVEFSPVFPDHMPQQVMDPTTLRWVARSNGFHGFLFLNHYQRHLKMQDVPNVQFHLKLANSPDLIFPQNPITIPADTIAILPFNLDLDPFLLVSATVQPLCILNHSQNGSKTYVFTAISRIDAELTFSNHNIRKISGVNFNLEKLNDVYLIRVSEPGLNVEIIIESIEGKIYHLLVLSPDQGLHAWKISHKSNNILIVADAKVVSENNTIKFQCLEKPHLQFSIYPLATPCEIVTTVSKISAIKKDSGIFQLYEIDFSPKEILLSWEENSTITSNLPKAKADKNPIPFLPHIFFPLYDPVLAKVNAARYWTVTIPQDIFAGISDAFLSITYEGDTQAIYLKDKLISDNFYAGEPMLLGLKRFQPDILGQELVLLITPMKNLSKIYLEPYVKTQFSTQSLDPKIESIQVLPQYEFKLDLS